jgi:hypothetical protein
MVFAAFVFTAESTIAGATAVFGVTLPHWGVAGALVLSLAGVGMLIRCAFLESYKYPPALPGLREQAHAFFGTAVIIELPEEARMEKFEGKYVDSLSRCIDANFKLTARIGKDLERASWLIADAVLG